MPKNQQYLSFFKEAPYTILVFNQNWNIVDINIIGCDLLEYTYEEALKLNLKDIAYAIESENPLPSLINFKNEKPIINKRILKSKSGKSISFDVTSKLSSNGQIISICRDLSEEKETVVELKKSENRLLESEKLNRSLVQHSPIAIIIQDINQNIVFANPKALEIVGVESLDEVIGKSFFDFTTIENTGLIKSRVKEMLRTGKSAPFMEQPFMHRDGTYRYGESTIIPFEYKGEPAILTVVNDISEIKKVSSQLQQNEAKLREIIDLVPFNIFAKDDKGNILLANKAFANAYATTPEYISKNKSLPEPFAPSKKLEKEFLKIDQKVISTKQAITTPVESFTDIHGDIKFLQTTKVPYTAKDNSGIKLLGISIDITERINSEREIKKITDDLIKSNNELQQFAYLTSHDLRAPVVNLSSLLNFYNKENPLDKDNHVIIEKIENSVEQLQNTLNDLVNIVALKKQDREENIKVSFSQITKDVKKSINQEIKITKVEINTNFHVRSIHYPKTHINSIIQNMLTNAIKYRSPKRPLIVSIRTYKKEHYTCLEIADNGIGIDMNKFGSKLFGIYQRFHDAPNSKGLGLYIVKTQVEQMGGYIKVNSKVNHGTIFSIFLKSTN